MSKVYLMKPCDVDELKNAVREEITATPDNMVREAMRTLCDRLEQCSKMPLQEVKHVTVVM
jgi:hypothetical protein